MLGICPSHFSSVSYSNISLLLDLTETVSLRFFFQYMPDLVLKLPLPHFVGRDIISPELPKFVQME